MQLLRTHRAVYSPNWSIASQLAGLATQARRTTQRLHGLADAWSRVIPRSLQQRSMPIEIRRGQLHVRVADATAQFELDRFLRTGGLDELIRSGGGVAPATGGAMRSQPKWAIRRVVFEHGPMPTEDLDARQSKRRVARDSTRRAP